jgi:hypothetical protein
MKSSEEAIKRYNTLQEIVDQLEKVGYNTTDGNHPIEMNAAFIALKRKAEDENEILLILKTLNEESLLVVPEENTLDSAFMFISEKDDECGMSWSDNTDELSKALVEYANKFLI